MNGNDFHIIVLVSNEADEFFLNCLLTYYQENLSQKSIRSWEIFNLKGVRRITQKIDNKVYKLLSEKKENTCITVFAFCSKGDFYPFCEKPVIDWSIVKNIFSQYQGIDHYSEIEVNNLIEDWILDDIEGLCDYLHTNVPDIIKGENGYQKILTLFKEASKQYISSYSVRDIFPFLNLEKIRDKRKESLFKLENALNINNGN